MGAYTAWRTPNFLLVLDQDLGWKDVRITGDIIHMVAQCHKKIKEELTAPGMHLQLHGPATLKRVSTANYEGEVMCSKLGVVVRGVGVRIAC